VTVIRYQEYEYTQIERLDFSKTEFVELPTDVGFNSLFVGKSVVADSGIDKRIFITRRHEGVGRYLQESLKYTPDKNSEDLYHGFESKIVMVDDRIYELALKTLDAYALLVGVVKAQCVSGRCDDISKHFS